MRDAEMFLQRWLAERPLVQGVFDAADMGTIMALLSDYGDARAAAERARAVNIAALVFVRDPYALHPDIHFDALNESARTAAHSIAQTIAGLIADG